MENHIFRLQNGSKAEMSVIDMQNVHKYYECQCTADYIRENFPDLSEDKIQEYASEVRTSMDKYDYSEDEAIDAIMELSFKRTDRGCQF